MEYVVICLWYFNCQNIFVVDTRGEWGRIYVKFTMHPNLAVNVNELLSNEWLASDSWLVKKIS